MESPLITNDAIVLGLLVGVLGLVFYTRSLGGRWTTFYTFVPVLLLCYLLPSLMNSFGLISSEGSNLWPVAKNYFLPACLVLMTLSIDLKAIIGLGPKALIMFFTATAGIVIGGPIAIFIVSLFSPETVGGEGMNAVWRGFATLAGSWIGGGANQTAMLEVYGYNPDRYAAMVAIDVVVANIWMVFLLYGAGNSAMVDKWLKADTSAIDRLKSTMENYTAEIERKSSLVDFMMITAVAFTSVGIAHLVGQVATTFFLKFEALQETILVSDFFWIVVTATTIGISLSFTQFRNLEGAGASKVGSVFIFLLVAVIGTRMDVFQIGEAPMLFVVGLVWMLIHVTLLLIVAKMIRAPLFFVAVGSQANVGGAASAPVVAAAFHPALAPVGVLLAVLGYALGTYGAIIAAELMRLVVE
ncbi:MAG: DUF819 family protein [Gammaproteobacteria bacterium]|nr:DUF819 family protein [Gammaproteobacteria bacterium]MDH5241294.1 DUF819 family protein [Gammaproteobacteria bacterium]MDH5260838.1 DUF819 family protein [Gammaproteobacteria bacterium]MDH5582812.1 DUF819 family protein [Gammaproteobacteria bacterium]